MKEDQKHKDDNELTSTPIVSTNIEQSTTIPELYIKPGPDGISAGDCPFAQYVRIVLEEKNTRYELFPTTREAKPSWLLEPPYNGSLPALRYNGEIAVESDIICKRIESMITGEGPSVSLSCTEEDGAGAAAATDGFFPAVARYLKHIGDGDEEDRKRREDLEQSLRKLNVYLEGSGRRSGPFLVGGGERITLVDCALAPKLYHMEVGVGAFKSNALDLERSFPAVRKYMDVMFGRESFRKTSYPHEFIVWGWSEARGK